MNFCKIYIFDGLVLFEVYFYGDGRGVWVVVIFLFGEGKFNISVVRNFNILGNIL